MHKLKIAVILAIAALLSSCKYSDEDFLQHPDLLQKAVLSCQSRHDDSAYCNRVKEYSADFVKLLDIRESNPEIFGKKILENQQQLAKLQELLAQSEQEYKKAKQDHLSAVEVDKAQEKLKFAKEAYNIQLRYVKTLLAVISASSSEGL